VQPSNPPVTRRRRDADSVGECTVGHAGIAVQREQDPAIDVVEFGALNILR
jgi:hypothetical protein